MSNNTEKFGLIFIGGDLCGIQKFIYNISSKKAMVSLKGRSAYLQDFMDEVCQEIISYPAIKQSPNTDVVYSSGGKFYIITDNTVENISHICSIKERCEQKLWTEHHGQLAININYVPFTFNSDNTVSTLSRQSAPLGELWKQITILFNKQKGQRFKNLIAQHYEQFFEVQNVGGAPKICAITGIESSDCIKFDKDNDGDEIWVLPSVQKQIDMGQRLRNLEHFKTLEQYADDSYLGVLRMDVDNLGRLFINGFNTLVEYKYISGKLDSFFKRTVHEIKEKYAENMNIVYSGGDDIFAVGKWNCLIQFAKEVHDEFAARINNPNVTISGGIAIVDSKFPISKAAEIAGEAEDSAKLYNNGQKNAFNCFGETVSWEKEFDYISKYKKQFVDYVNGEFLSRGLLHQIMRYSKIIKENDAINCRNKNQQEQKCSDLSYIWHSAYYLTRYISKNKENKDIVAFCEDLRDRQLLTTRNFILMSIAARWAELELR